MRDRSTLPGWPRGLGAELAAAYVGVSINKFLEEVEQGLWPPPKRRGGRLIWDREAIDRAPGFDSGVDPAERSGAASTDDPLIADLERFREARPARR